MPKAASHHNNGTNGGADDGRAEGRTNGEGRRMVGNGDAQRGVDVAQHSTGGAVKKTKERTAENVSSRGRPREGRPSRRRDGPETEGTAEQRRQSSSSSSSSSDSGGDGRRRTRQHKPIPFPMAAVERNKIHSRQRFWGLQSSSPVLCRRHLPLL